MKNRGQRRIGILMADRSNPFWTDMKRHYDRLSEEMDLETEYFWPVPPHAPSVQSAMLLKMIGSGFDAIIVNPMNNNNLVPGICRAASKKIPILDVGAKTDQRLLAKTSSYYLPVSTVDFFLQGRLGAEYIIHRLQSGKSSNVVILEGRPDSAQSIGRSGGASEIFKTNPNIRLLLKEQAGFSRSKANMVTKDIYLKNKTIDAFFCVNDLMALGVADAVGDLKGTKRPIIVGVDLIDEAREAIKEGRISASVAFSRAEVAASVLKKAVDCIEAVKGPSLSPVSSHLVCFENIRDFDD